MSDQTSVFKGRGPPKRVRRSRRIITDQRRDQNRLAQRVHRDKEKRRLQELKDLVRAQQHTNVHDVEQGCGEQAAQNDLAEAINEGVGMAPSVVSNYDTGDGNNFSVSQQTGQPVAMQSRVSLQAATTRLCGLPKDHSWHGYDDEGFAGASAYSSSENLRFLGVHQNPRNVSIQDGTAFDRLIPSFSQESISKPDCMSFGTGLSTSSSVTRQDLFSSDLDRHMIPRYEDVDQLRTLILDKGISFGAIINAGVKAYSSTYDLVHTSTIAPTHSNLSSVTNTCSLYPYLADPLKNHIHLSNVSLTAACVANLTHIGVVHALACQQMRSPFHDPSFTTSMFTHLKPDLQPCASQISQPHPLYIDALPFPTFRDHIIALRSIEPKLFDENNLWDDIANGGLVCWGNMADVNIGSGSPWDKRSWEIKGWFLRKWWMLTGGVEGDLGRQSKWWCEMRGERFR